MSEPLYDFNSTYWLSMATMTFGFCGVCLAYALKSKCSKVKCCCIEIDRDIEAELEEDRMVGVPNLPNQQPQQQQPQQQNQSVRRISRQNSPQEDLTVVETTASRRQSRREPSFVDFATSMTGNNSR